MPSLWSLAAAQPELADDEVHVWRGRLEPLPADFPRLAECLSAEERARAARFRFARHRDRYVAVRGALRHLLAGYLGRPPAEIRFQYGNHGKPELAEELKPGGCCFNVSHSGDLALFGFVRGRRIGVDVERRHEVSDALALAERFFSPGESAAVRARVGAARRDRFLQIWTRKEAIIKAIGTGLAMPLDRFDVSMLPEDEPAMLSVEESSSTGSAWMVTDLRPDAAYLAAAAVEGGDARIVCWHREG